MDDLDIPAFLLVRNRPQKPAGVSEDTTPVMTTHTRAHRTSDLPNDAPAWFTGNRNTLPKTMDDEAWEAVRLEQERAKRAKAEGLERLAAWKEANPDKVEDQKVRAKMRRAVAKRARTARKGRRTPL